MHVCTGMLSTVLFAPLKILYYRCIDLKVCYNSLLMWSSTWSGCACCLRIVLKKQLTIGLSKYDLWRDVLRSTKNLFILELFAVFINRTLVEVGCH